MAVVVVVRQDPEAFSVERRAEIQHCLGISSLTLIRADPADKIETGLLWEEHNALAIIPFSMGPELRIRTRVCGPEMEFVLRS